MLQSSSFEHFSDFGLVVGVKLENIGHSYKASDRYFLSGS